MSYAGAGAGEQFNENEELEAQNEELQEALEAANLRRIRR